MKAVILAGGFGTRLSEETAVRPKPMVEIGGMPMLWHLMKIYGAYGIEDFVIAAGYRGYVIKEYFANYYLHRSDVVVDLARNTVEMVASHAEPWRVTIVDTGDDTMTGGRLLRLKEHLDDTFCMTYGDALAKIDIGALVEFHRTAGVAATLTAVQPPGRFGALGLSEEAALVQTFREKPTGDGGWVNGGFFVLEPRALDYIQGDETVWEREPLERLAEDGQLAAFRYAGYWQNMDSLRDKVVLEEHWASGSPPWRVW